MALQPLDINKIWYRGTLCDEPDWDNIKDPLEAWAASLLRDINQLALDMFGPTYSFDNDGLPNNPVTLYDFSTHTSALPWIFSNTVTFNSTVVFGGLVAYTGDFALSDVADDHFYIFNRPFDLAADRNITLPLLLADDTFVFANFIQTLRNKSIGGAGVGVANIQYANSANTRTYTIPDTGADTGLLTNEHYPIGSFLHFSDYNGVLPMPNATIWHLCSGAAIADVLSSLNGITPLDMTGRYLVGFTTGVEGDASIGAVGNCNVAVGNALHQINIQHLHDITHGHADTFTFTVDAHTHDISHGHANTISASVPGHYHGMGAGANLTVGSDGVHGHNLMFSSTDAPNFANGDYLCEDTLGTWGSSEYIASFSVTNSANSAHTHSTINGSIGLITGGSDGNAAFAASMGGSVTSLAGSSGGASANTTTKGGGVTNFAGNSANALSAAQSIQPRSVQCRVYVRKR